MMGEDSGSHGRFFYRFALEERVPADHLLRKIDAVLDLEAPVAACTLLQSYWPALDVLPLLTSGKARLLDHKRLVKLQWYSLSTTS